MKKILLLSILFLNACLDKSFAMQSGIEHFDSAIENTLLKECEELIKDGNLLQNGERNGAVQIFSDLWRDMIKWGGINFLLHAYDKNNIQSNSDINKLNMLCNHSDKKEEYRNIVKKMEEVINGFISCPEFIMGFNEAKQKTLTAKKAWQDYKYYINLLEQNSVTAIACNAPLPISYVNPHLFFEEAQRKTVEAQEAWETISNKYTGYTHAILVPRECGDYIGHRDKFLTRHAFRTTPQDSIILKTLLLLQYNQKQLRKNWVNKLINEKITD